LTDEVISSNETGQRFKNYIPELFWKPGKQDWDGQHREVRREIVHIEYELEWIADRLHFSIKNQPSNRNYVVFLVIEEKMQYTGNVLHTAVALPVNGLLTYVPQTFFDDEFAAHARTAAVIAGLIAKQIPSAPGPTDPVIGWVRPGDLATRAGVNRILDLANEHQPALLREIVAQVTQRDQLGADEIP
jgi:hypothetical protein